MEPSTETRAIFVTGLRNAHAMEKQALSVIETQVNRLESYPELTAMLQQHHRETEQQLARLDQIFQEFGESPSTVKDTVLSAMGAMQAMSHAVADDEVLKNVMADYMFEHFEIAAYTSLISMAQSVGFASAVSLLEQSLGEEKRCADMLLNALPGITQTFLQRTEAGVKADV